MHAAERRVPDVVLHRPLDGHGVTADLVTDPGVQAAEGTEGNGLSSLHP